MKVELTEEELRLVIEGLGMKRAMLETGTPFYSHDDAARMDERTRKKMGIRLATREQILEAGVALDLMLRLQSRLN